MASKQQQFDHDLRNLETVQLFAGERMSRLESQVGRLVSQIESEGGTLDRTHKDIFATLADHDNRLRGNGTLGLVAKVQALEDFMDELKWHLRRLWIAIVTGFVSVAAVVIGALLLRR